MCLSYAFEVTNEISIKLLSNFLVQEKNISKIPASFDNSFELLSMNSRIEAAKFESEPKFENTINEIEDNHLKGITYIDMNLSAITSNKTSSSSKHLKPISCHGYSYNHRKNHQKPPIFIYLMHYKGNIQLEIRKW